MIRRLLILGLCLGLGLSVSRAAVSTHTVVSLTFDDAYNDAPLAGQLMNQYGFKGTFYIISGVLGGTGYMTVAQVQALQTAGHEIGGHTITHPHLTTLTTAQAEHEICDGRTQLVNLGFPAVSFAYPFGDSNATTEAIVKSCYVSGRGAWQLGCTYDGCDPGESIPPVDPYWIRTPDAVLYTTTLDQLKSQVTVAENAGGGWVPMQFHHVCDGCDGKDANAYSVSSTTLNAFLSWLQPRSAQGTVVETVKQVMSGGAFNPVPAITVLSPAGAAPGSPAFTLTVNGTNFVSSSTVQWNGTNRVTTFFSATKLTAAISAGDVASAGTATVTVFNPAPGGGTSPGQTFAITAPVYSLFGSSAPAVGNSSPDTTNYNLGMRWRSDTNGSVVGIRYYRWSTSTGVHVGDLWTNTGTKLAEATFTGGTASGWQTVYFSTPVTVTAGTTYVASYWTNTGFAVTTNFFAAPYDNAPLHAPAYSTGTLNGLYGVSATQTFPASSTNKSNYWVDVLFSQSSSSQTPPSNPVPALASVSPSSATAGGSAFTLTLNGSNFISSSNVQWNGVTRPTTFVSATSLTAAIPASDLVSSGTVTVTVLNPAPGGGTSAAQTFTINSAPLPPNPVPVLSSITPSSATAGGAAFTLNVNGSNFVSSSTVRWNGVAQTTTFVSSTLLQAAIPASLLVSSGTAAVTVLTPAPGGGASAAQTFTINAAPLPPNPVPALTSMTPNSATAGGGAFTLNVTGSNFISSSTVRWNGSTRVTTYVSATALSAAISASDIAAAGSALVTVFNPAPGGGTSGNSTFTISAASGTSSGPVTIWGSSAPAAGAGWKDPASVEVGVRFRSDVAGYITGVRFYKWSFSTGTHVGNLWTNTGALLASATFTAETASGWQTVYFSNPVAIAANTTYVASYFTTTGYAVSPNAFTVGVDNAPLHALASGVDGLNGLYLYSAASAFPNKSTKTSNYWVDVVFNTTPSGGGGASGSLSAVNPLGTNQPAGVFADLTQVRVYPNPWRKDRTMKSFITFDQMSPNSTVKIFTVSAHWVRTLEASGDSATWDLKNSAGDAVASGFYIYLISSPNAANARGTLAIIR